MIDWDGIYDSLRPRSRLPIEVEAIFDALISRHNGRYIWFNDSSYGEHSSHSVHGREIEGAEDDAFGIEFKSNIRSKICWLRRPQACFRVKDVYVMLDDPLCLEKLYKLVDSGCEVVC